MANIKVGDTVHLKSGGPLMTVTYVGADKGCTCKWFMSEQGEHAVPKSAEFPPEALTPVA